MRLRERPVTWRKVSPWQRRCPYCRRWYWPERANQPDCRAEACRRRHENNLNRENRAYHGGRQR